MAGITAQETITAQYTVEEHGLQADGSGYARVRVSDAATGAVIRRAVLYLAPDGTVSDETRKTVGTAGPGLAAIQGATAAWTNVIAGLVGGKKVTVSEPAAAVAAVADAEVIA